MSPRRRLLAMMLLLAAAVWSVYWNSLHVPFAFDDWHVIQQNPAIRGPANVPSFFRDISTFSILPANRDYRPVFLTSMALSWWLGGGSTLPFHLVSVALHTGSVLLLLSILLRLFTRENDPVGGLRSAEAETAAFLAAALFALHPLASEAVIYISSQSILLAAFFFLLSFLLFLTVYAREATLPGLRKWVLCVGSYGSYLVALLSKPIAFTLPGILLLWELLFGRRASQRDGEMGSAWSRSGRRVRKHLPYVGVSLLYLGIRRIVVIEPFGGPQPIRPLLTHYLTETKALVFYYLKLALAPLHLNADREYPLSSSLLDGEVVLALVILMGIGGVLLRLRRHRNLVFWPLWFVVCLSITTYGVILRQLVREARAYLALAAVCAIAGLLFVKLWGAFPVRVSDLSVGKRSGRTLAAALIGLVLVAFGLGTMGRSEVWSSSLTLWEDAALHGGTWRAHMNYGRALENAGRPDEALAQLEKALELGPYSWAHMNLGLALMRRGNHEEGLRHLRTAVELWPTSPEPHYFLATALDGQGHREEAERELREAVALRSNYLNAHRYMARLQERRGDVEQALASYRRLLELDPTQSWVEENIQRLETAQLFEEAFRHQKLGDRARAIELYEGLLQLDPMHRQGTFNLAYAYKEGSSSSGWPRSALLFKKVLEIDPSYSEALFHLATMSWKLGNEDEARKYDRLYLEKGSHPDLRRRSEERLAREGQ